MKLYSRLDAQHLLWRLHNGCVLNAKIPTTPDMKVAEIGTGTGYIILRPTCADMIANY